jgi:hypothetical protein
MHRRHLIAALVALAASPALAAGPVDRVVGDLRRLGFSSITVSRTLLGRSRVVAERDDGTREIILNPITGEILRDLWLPRGGNGSGGGLLGGERQDDDDGDDDEDEDDEDDDDDDEDDDHNSGKGGDNSGSGKDGKR